MSFADGNRDRRTQPDEKIQIDLAFEVAGLRWQSASLELLQGLCGGEDDFNLYAYVGNDPLNKTDPTGMYESHWLLRALVPGQVTFDNAMTAAENGNYGQAAALAGAMVGEQVLTVASLGTASAATQTTRAVASTEGKNLSLRYKPGWSASQRAAADHEPPPISWTPSQGGQYFVDTFTRWTIARSEVGDVRKKVTSPVQRRIQSEAVRLANDSGKPVTQVARELGVNTNVLHRWMREEREAAATSRTRGTVKVEQEEIIRLRRELARVTEERDFLKRAAAFFAKDHK